jgi:serine protease inhibitor
VYLLIITKAVYFQGNWSWESVKHLLTSRQNLKLKLLEFSNNFKNKLWLNSKILYSRSRVRKVAEPGTGSEISC